MNQSFAHKGTVLSFPGKSRQGDGNERTVPCFMSENGWRAERIRRHAQFLREAENRPLVSFEYVYGIINPLQLLISDREGNHGGFGQCVI